MDQRDGLSVYKGDPIHFSAYYFFHISTFESSIREKGCKSKEEYGEK